MAVQNSLAARVPKQGLAAYLTQDAVKNQINSMIGGKNGTRFVASIISAVQANPVLQECTNPSIVSAALLGESLNLSPSPQLGQYYLVPFNNSEKKVKEAQFQLGYKGYIQLAIRSGQYKKLNVLAIKEGELIRFDPLNEEIEVNLIDDEEAREEAATVGYYAMFEYVTGFKKAMYWSRTKMIAHAKKYSQGYRRDLEKGSKYTFWSKDFDGMAYKTMLRQLISKWGIMSIEMQSAYDADLKVVEEDMAHDYVSTDMGEAQETAEDMSQESVSSEASQPVQETPPAFYNAEADFFNN